MENVFKKAGWLLLTVPQEGVAPRELLVKDGPGYIKKLNSPLQELLLPREGTAYPDVSEDRPLPTEISGSVKINLNTAANISWMQSVLHLGKADAKVRAAYEDAGELLVNFHNPVVNDVPIVALDIYLNKAAVNKDAMDLSEQLYKGNVYVVTSIIKCQQFTIQRLSNKGISGGAGISMGAVGEAALSVDRKSQNDLKITTEGNNWLVVAIKAVRIFYDKAGFFSSKPSKFRTESADENVRSDANDREYLAPGNDNNNKGNNNNNNHEDGIDTLSLTDEPNE